MPWWKYVANRFLTLFENTFLGAKLSEYHTGYRAFSRAVLKELPLLENSDDFVFDNQMLAQCVMFGFRIGEVSCPTKYFPEASSINFRRSVQYGLGVLLTSVQFRLQKMGLAKIPDFQSQRPLPGAGHRRALLQSGNDGTTTTAGPAADVAERTRIARRDVGLGTRAALRWLALLPLSAFAILMQGYHPGLEDDAFYLAAIKQNLNPSLFPHDADFFRVQFQATVFDKLIASSVRWTHVPLEWGILFWQWGVTFLILWGCWRISRRCFAEAHAQWAAVTLVAVLLTLPVSGTGLTLTDQYLHPRALATALILAAIVAVLDRTQRLLVAGALLTAAFFVHAIMAAFGASYCLFLLWRPAQANGRPSSGVQQYWRRC